MGEKAWSVFPTSVEVQNCWCAFVEIVKKVIEMLLQGDFIHSVTELKV